MATSIMQVGISILSPAKLRHVMLATKRSAKEVVRALS